MYELQQTAASGDRLETLRALRQKLAQIIDESNSGRDIAALSRQLQQVIFQIDEIEKEKAKEETTGANLVDMIRAKHAGRAVRDERRKMTEQKDPDELSEIRPPKEERGAELGRY